MCEWRGIETAPKDGSIILVWDGATDGGPSCGVVAAYWAEWDDDDDPEEGAFLVQAGAEWEFREIAGGDYLEGVTPTHWMPLPEPPK